MIKLNIGDVVYLKSGSPAFTVQEIDGTDVIVSWFNEGKIERNRLKIAQLSTEKPNI